VYQTDYSTNGVINIQRFNFVVHSYNSDVKPNLIASKSSNNTSVPQDKLDHYDKLVATILKIERKGATIPYTSVNGNMFTFLSGSGVLAIRLPEDARINFIKKYKTTLMEAHGVTMKEYVAVPDNLFKSLREIDPFLEMSFEYAISLKPKATKKTLRPKKN
jgi:hypothetical protein